MSAPIISNVSLTRKMFRGIVLGSTCINILTPGLVYIFLNSNTRFDVIHKPIIATEILTSLTLVMHMTFRIMLWNLKGGKMKNIQPWKHKSELFRCVGLFIMSTLVFHMVAVLFGAAFTEQTSETFHFAMLLAATTVGPILIHLGTSSEAWVRIFACNSPELGTEMMVYITCICSMVGAWLGACVIPLDWDRPWQVWPVSCILGTVAGHCVGLMVNALYLSVRYWEMSKIKLT